MIARITLILTMLLSTAHSPFCRCSAASDGNTSELAMQVEVCTHCCEHESNSLPCPARPDCCCRTSQVLILADIQDSDFVRDSQPNGTDVFFSVSPCSFLAISHKAAGLATGMPVNSGCRALLIRTCRLQI